MTHRRGVGVAAPGPRRIRYAVVPVAAALTAMVVGGCSPDDPTPSPTPTVVSTSPSPSASSPSPSPSPTKSEPVKVEVPAAAKKQTPEGAVAFVKFYIDLTNIAWTRPNPQVLRKYSTEECGACKFFITTAADLQKLGRRYESDPVSVTKATSRGSATPTTHIVQTTIAQHKVNVLDDAGAVVSTDPADTLNRRIQLKWVGGQWLLDEIAE